MGCHGTAPFRAGDTVRARATSQTLQARPGASGRPAKHSGTPSKRTAARFVGGVPSLSYVERVLEEAPVLAFRRRIDRLQRERLLLAIMPVVTEG